ncbi:Uncharacterized protein GBIM_08011 [Gryllus bimaculatus]|nr:Uncharacterized protein GBIM_08011 [Gryllus bimaculatus]
MLNKAMPFDDTNIKRLHEQQMNRRWKFRSKVIDTLSEQVKKLVTNLLEPDVTKRWRMDQVLNSEWVAMDPRLLALTAAEQAAVKAAADEKSRRKGGSGEKKTSGSKRNSSQDEATSEAVTVIKDNRGNLGPVKSEKIDDPRFKSPDEED